MAASACSHSISRDAGDAVDAAGLDAGPPGPTADAGRDAGLADAGEAGPPLTAIGKFVACGIADPPTIELSARTTELDASCYGGTDSGEGLDVLVVDWDGVTTRLSTDASGPRNELFVWEVRDGMRTAVEGDVDLIVDSTTLRGMSWSAPGSRWPSGRLESGLCDNLRTTGLHNCGP